MTTAGRTRRRVRVTGVVQGVGFRPFVHRLAERHGLEGFVRNEAGEVEIVIDGNDDAVGAFLDELVAAAPPLSQIDGVESEPIDDAATYDGFRILESPAVAGRRQPIPADVVLCDECERELFDPASRRYHYPFITCTACGPRYTVVESAPYDRERTSMRRFAQCPDCRREYETIGDRRYHSETNSCPSCGPRLWTRRPGTPVTIAGDMTTRAALDEAASALRGGRIVAVRGVGGFHLAVDAANDDAVRRLRERKHREAKPFAIMVRDLDKARTLAAVTPADAALLTDRARPVVLMRPLDRAPIAASVAPGLDSVGIMLAYTPVHLLLLELVDRPLVMTSGNRSEEPIAASIDDATERLDGIADLFLLHDREIVSPVDDSVVRACGEHAIRIRRARGFAPLPTPLPAPTPLPLLAVGGHLKSTFTIAQGGAAFVSPHLGDLDGLETLAHYRATLDRYTSLFGIEPRVVVRDLHDGYLSTRIAAETGLPAIVVQHHHAHIAAVLGEQRHDGPVVGIAYDGTGMGDDRTIWGAEFLIATQSDYARAGHLRAAPLPGGELAIRSPWRCALGYASLEPGAAESIAAAFGAIEERDRHAVDFQLSRRVNTPIASSMGRLFDAAAAVLGLCDAARFEGEAAMRLESAAAHVDAAPLPFPIVRDDRGMLQLNPVPLLVALADERRAGRAIDVLAAAFHESVAAATAEVALELCASAGLDVVALGGGVFQNARLTGSLHARLRGRGIRVLLPIDLPANDGGLSYGQAVVAAALLRDAPSSGALQGD